MAQDEEWSAAWRQAEPKVLAYCRRSLRSQADADDVAQRVAMRSWRGYGGFRKDAHFTTWALAIAKREVIRFVQSRKPETLVDDPDKMGGATPPPELDPPEIQLRAACAALEKAGLASKFECDVLIARLDEEDATWGDIAKRIGGDANVCAVAHCRAIPKLRLHLFLTTPDAIGGKTAIADAFQAAKKIPPPPGLTPREAELFETIVMHRAVRQDAVASAAVALRSACDKIIRRMPMGV